MPDRQRKLLLNTGLSLLIAPYTSLGIHKDDTTVVFYWPSDLSYGCTLEQHQCIKLNGCTVCFLRKLEQYSSHSSRSPFA